MFCPRVYRMGTIGPHSETGEMNPNDLFAYLAVVVRACGVPRGSVLPLNWVAVDVVAAAIARLASSDCRRGLAVYHLQSATPALDDCFDAGVPRCDVGAWRARVAALTADPGHPCHAVRDTLLAIEFSSPGGGVVDTTQTRKLLGRDVSFDYTKEMLAKVKSKCSAIQKE